MGYITESRIHKGDYKATVDPAVVKASDAGLF